VILTFFLLSMLVLLADGWTDGKYINFKLEFPKRKAGADGRK
jgi:hypothetical protein